MSAAATAPAIRYPVHRTCAPRPRPAVACPLPSGPRPRAARRQLAGASPIAAPSATAGTAAPAPAAAPLTHRGGWAARNSADRARMTISPGTMKQNPPTRAPSGPRSRHAQ